MAFTPEPTVTPESIGTITITLRSYTDGPPGHTFVVQIVRDDGSIYTVTGDLEEHLTATELTGVETFMATLRVKAQGLIP